jgi:DNA modification methylase
VPEARPGRYRGSDGARGLWPARRVWHTRDVNGERPYTIACVDAFEWLAAAEPRSVHAVVTDPPYGVREYSAREVSKLRAGHGGVWRIPPTLGGRPRRPVPRFTVLSDEERADLFRFFERLADGLWRVLVPGAHVFVASNPLLSHLAYEPLIKRGFEKRGEIVRLVQTLRGGDRPKNAHAEWPEVSVMPRSKWEPWGLFRKPCEGRVQDNLRRFGTGGLRRVSPTEPFGDVVPSAPTGRTERRIAPHPSLKPQAFVRRIVRASLPLGRGTILDPFLGGGSTVAAATALGLASIGLERDPEYFALAERAIPQLAALDVPGEAPLAR